MLRQLVTLLLALVAGWASPPAQASTDQWFGFNDISSLSHRMAFDTAAGAAANAGATSTRFVVDWSWVEPADGTYTWGMVDGVYWADLARGLRPLIGITGAPRWAWEDSASCPALSTCAYPPGRAHDADFQELIRRLTRRYPRAAGIQIGNEPNLGWAWAGGVDPARYTELLELGYDAVKSVDPSMPVIAGGLAPVLNDDVGPSSVGLRPFLRAMYANGAKGHMDGIAVHPYARDVDFSLAFAALNVADEERTAHDDQVPLWVTETGMTTTGASAFSERDQGIGVASLYSALRADPDIAGVYVHTLYEDPLNVLGDERGYGLLRTDQTPKPAYCALAAARGSDWRCPPGVPAATPTAAQSARFQAETLLEAAAAAAIRSHGPGGSYADVTAAGLHAIDGRISAQALTTNAAPGAAADPSRIGIYPAPAGSGDAIVLCNASRADRSYCVVPTWGSAWRYGSALGPVFAAAGATVRGQSETWSSGDRSADAPPPAPVTPPSPSSPSSSPAASGPAAAAAGPAGPAATAQIPAVAPARPVAAVGTALGKLVAAAPTGPAVTIDNGARFTRDRRVRVTVTGLEPGARWLVSDSAAFRHARRVTAGVITWRLPAAGGARRAIYVRTSDGRVLRDTIVLDRSAPVVRAARLGATLRRAARSRYVVRVTARDGVSGVASTQFAVRRSRPGAVSPFRAVTVLTPRPRFVRVVDRAGNWSAWQRLR